MSYDTIIVGSGVGGMTAALVLAKEGQKVLVLEQNVRPGGLMQTFSRKGLIFPTGVHCMGSLDEGQILWRYFKYLGVLDRLHLVPMDPDGFTEIRCEAERYRVPCGKSAFRDRIVEYCGSESEVDQFVADMADTVAQFPLYNLDLKPKVLVPDIQKVSVQTYLETLTDNRRLRAVLSATWPFYGMLPSECPLYTHFLVLDSFLNSSYRVNESETSLALAFVDELQAAGGELRCGTEVVSIDCPEGVIRGVRLADGEFIPSRMVVFTGHPKLIPSLCSKGSLRPVFCERLRTVPETEGVFGVAMAWPDKRCPMASRDVLLYDSLEFPTSVSQRLFGVPERPAALYCSASPGVADGPRAVVAMCMMNYEEMRGWEDTTTGHRPRDYVEAKMDLSERIISVIQERWPDAAEGVEILDSFSPLSCRDYTLSPAGSAYGVKRSVGSLRTATIGPATHVKGLYLAGQNVILSGVVGTVISSIEACSKILGRSYLLNRIAEGSS